MKHLEDFMRRGMASGYFPGIAKIILVILARNILQAKDFLRYETIGIDWEMLPGG